jgi:hypothetical protein
MILTKEEEQKLNEYLNQPSFNLLVNVLGDIYNQVFSEFPSVVNQKPESWEYYSDVLVGNKVGLNVIYKILYKLRSRKTLNNSKRMAQYKGMIDVFNRFLTTLKIKQSNQKGG